MKRVFWAGNFTDCFMLQRTTELKLFRTRREARNFMRDKRGYVTVVRDSSSKFATDKMKVQFVEYFGGFEPSAQEYQKMRSFIEGDIPIK